MLMPEPDDSEWGKYLTYGLQICVGVALGAWIGHWLDKRYGWKTPWGVIFGSMLGVAGGLYLLLKDAMKMNKD
jgi:F0F1-type ATP synthase assembly protein I